MTKGNNVIPKPSIAQKAKGAPQGSDGQDRSQRDINAKVARLATITSVSAFVATGCLIFAFVTHSQASTALADVESDMKTAVVAAKQIGQGSTITADMVTTMQIPGRYIASDTPSSVEEVVGKQAVVCMKENAQVRTACLNRNDDSSSLASRISKGMKAVSISVNTETDFAQSLLHQGDRVSLYCFEDGKKMRICKDAEVLALDGYTSYADLSDDGVTAEYSTVTVEVSKSKAEEIRGLQDSKSSIWMVLTASTDVKR